MAELMKEELAEVVGPKGKNDPERSLDGYPTSRERSRLGGTDKQLPYLRLAWSF